MSKTPLILTIAAVMVTACTHNPAPNPGAHMWNDTTFSFTENIPGTDRQVEGTIRVIGVDATVDAQPGPCIEEPIRTLGYITVKCDDVFYYIDLTGSVVKVNYRTTKTVVDTRTTCVRYDVNAAGQRVCAQSQTERVERKEPVSGPIHLKNPER